MHHHLHPIHSMNISVKSYSVDYYGEPIAFVKVSFSVFAFRVKSEVTIVNGVKFEVLSKPQEKD